MKDLLKISKYQKFWIAVAAGVAQLLVVCAPTDIEAAFVVSTTEWYTVLLAIATAVGVRRIANR